jgi:hypothetical protein
MFDNKVLQMAPLVSYVHELRSGGACLEMEEARIQWVEHRI